MIHDTLLYAATQRSHILRNVFPNILTFDSHRYSTSSPDAANGSVQQTAPSYSVIGFLYVVPAWLSLISLQGFHF